FFNDTATTEIYTLSLHDALPIFTSDHGESFGDADLITHMFHDRGDFESTHHVPLLMLLPRGMQPSSKIVDRRVSIAEIAPTIYDFARLNWSAFQKEHPQYARSLFPLLLGSPPRYAAKVLVPKREKQDQSEAEQERAKALKALGYIH